jgi:hypothetical protein
MPVKYLPVIKVFDVSNVDIPQKVTITRKSDGKLWWKYANAVPTLKNEFNTIKIIDMGIPDRMVAYKFTQCLFNFMLYNNLQLNKPQKFTFTTDNDMCTFTYFIEEDEVIMIPKMPNNGQLIKFSLFENKFPVLKLQI